MPVSHPVERPTWACLLHRTPELDRGWTKADPGYRTCSTCLDKLREDLAEVGTRYRILDVRPGGSGEQGGRGAPGFGSRAPASVHIIAMRDHRSRSYEVSSDGVQYIWNPLADSVLEPGQYGPPGGAYVDKQDVWFGADGRGHREDSRPVRSVPHTLASLADLIAEERDMACTARTVAELVRWLDGQLDWVTRQEMVTDFADDIRLLLRQLKPVTGEPGRRHIGICPNTIDEGETTRPCNAKLYAPLRGDTITCTSCNRDWPRPEWENLGTLLGKLLPRAS